MRRFFIPLFTLLSILFTLSLATATDLSFLEGATIVAQDGQFLGIISTDTYDSKSINNPYGRYGSEYSSTSIWNDYSRYGSQYSRLSAFNDIATKPPMILINGEPVAYLTMNKSKSPRISPYALIAWLKENE